MNKKILEKDIQKLLIEYLKYRKDIYYIRNNAFYGSFIRNNGSQGFIQNNKKGSPDIILCYKGQWIGIEVKRNGGRQSSQQKDAEVAIRKAGGQYYIVKSLEQLEKIIN